MKEVQLNIPPIHARTIAVHLLIVLKNYLDVLNGQRRAASTGAQPSPPSDAGPSPSSDAEATSEGGSGEMESLPQPSAGEANSPPKETLQLLEHLDAIYQKLDALSDEQDDETPQPVALSIPEAEAFIKAFTEEQFEAAALRDAFYQKHSYPAYFAQVYSKYAERVSEGYVEALC